MSINPFSISNSCLLLISAALLAYFFYSWRVLVQRTPTAEFAIIKKPLLRFAGAYAAYLATISLLAANGFFTVITMPPRFLLVFVPLVVLVILLSKARLDRSLRFLQFLPPVLLVGVHVYRLFIELVFIRFADEKIIPAALSIHGRNFDLLIGVLAVPVACLFLKRYRLARQAGLAFNVLGLLSLVNIFTIVVPSMPSSFRVYDTLYLPTYFPGITIVFLASAAIFLHLLSLRQLLAAKEVSRTNATKTGAAERSLYPHETKKPAMGLSEKSSIDR